jgi:hypothetical protein
MMVSQPFKLIYAPQLKDHLKAIERKHHGLIRRTIEDQLQFEPMIETRNRKPLKRPIDFGADWELRLGPNNRFRVFYEINEVDREVYILAVGVKRGNNVFIGGEEIDL